VAELCLEEEFTNLPFEIIKDTLSTEFIHKTFDNILD